jgi:hypothetical protein
MSHDPYPTKFVIAEGVASEVDDPEDEISKRIYRRGSAFMAERHVDTERFIASWTAVGRIVFNLSVTNLITYDGTKTPKDEKYTTGTGMPGDRRSPVAER